jgi:hypothetical protein
MTETVTEAEVAQAVHRVADIVQGAVERYAVNDDGRAGIHARFVLYAMFDLDPATYFAPENREALALWADRWRQARRDGTRRRYWALHDAVSEALRRELPGDWRMDLRYTPEQIRDVARRISNDQGTKTA